MITEPRYEEEYLKQWCNRDDSLDVVLARRSYEKGFATEPWGDSVTP